MALVTTPAIVLHSFKYGETSKIVRLATRDFGMQSAIAKGALRSKSRFGARLELLSQGTAQLYMKENRELHTLAAFDVSVQRRELAADISRFAAAAALAELVMRFSPADPHPELFDLFMSQLDQLGDVSSAELGAASLSMLWRMIAVLGFAPTLAQCARDQRALPEGAAAFSIPDGGFLCSTCAASTNAPWLSADDRAVLVRLVSGEIAGLASIPPRHRAAHRRLLSNFARQHLAEDRELAALSFWENLPWNATS